MTTIGDPPLRILTVCTHNRTRSVMMAAMLQSMLGTWLGAERVQVRSGGFGPEGLPAIADAVEAMRRRDLDVSGHRSRQVTVDDLTDVDVVLTAEREHVVKIAALSPAAFRRTMTLPEFLVAAASAPIDDDLVDIRSWVQSLTEGRTASAYLRAPVPEIADPTGSLPRAFERSVVEIEQQCRDVGALVAMRLSRRHTAGQFDRNTDPAL